MIIIATMCMALLLSVVVVLVVVVVVVVVPTSPPWPGAILRGGILPSIGIYDNIIYCTLI